MRLWVKILVGAFAALVLFCVISGLILSQSGALERVREFGTGIFGISQTAKGLEALNSKHPFQEPADGRIPEERLVAYIEVRRAIRPTVAAYDAWMKAHEGKEGDFRDAREAIRLTSQVMEGLRAALDAQKMSPKEYAWLDPKVETALGQVREGAATATERDLLQTLRSLEANPRLTSEERQAIRSRIEEAEARTDKGGEPETPDAALCAKYRRELDATRLGEWGGMMVRGFVQADHGHHRRHLRAEAGPKEKS